MHAFWIRPSSPAKAGDPVIARPSLLDAPPELVIGPAKGRTRWRGMTGRYCSCARGADWRQRISRKKKFRKTFSLNACVGNVFAVSHSCDSCRIHVHLLHDRAPIAHDTTQNIFLHERSA
jgi:hypothetical protein